MDVMLTLGLPQPIPASGPAVCEPASGACDLAGSLAPFSRFRRPQIPPTQQPQRSRPWRPRAAREPSSSTLARTLVRWAREQLRVVMRLLVLAITALGGGRLRAPAAAPAAAARRAPPPRHHPAVVPPGVTDEQGVYCAEGAALAQRVLAECPQLHPASYYAPPPLWGSNGHAQTILASVLRATRRVEYARELLRTPDGGTLALDLLVRVEEDVASKGEGATIRPLTPADAAERGAGSARGAPPFLLLTSGLGGGSQDAYVRSMAAAAAREGWRVGVLNMRSCGGSPVTSPRLFSAHRGSTDDLRLAVAHARACAHLAAHSPVLAAMGWSNGATIVNNALAEQEEEGARSGGLPRGASRIDAAVSLAGPLDMPGCEANLRRPFHAAVYDRSIAAGLVRNFRQSGAEAVFERAQAGGGCVAAWDGAPLRVDVDALMRSTTIRQIDEALTRRTFGFDSVDAYYADASSAQRLGDVRVPLLLLNAHDDPLAPGRTLPYAAVRASEHVLLALTAHGGHLGWCDAARPFGPPRWAEDAACAFLASALGLGDEVRSPRWL